MQRHRRGLTVLSLVIILVVIGVLIFFLLRGRDVADPGEISPAATPEGAPVASTIPGALLTTVRAPLAPVAAGATDTVVVRLANEAGAPMIGIPVRFTAIAGEGRVAPAEVRTDSLGLATALWTIGAAPGTNTLRVEAETPRTPVPPLLVTVDTDAAR